MSSLSEQRYSGLAAAMGLRCRVQGRRQAGEGRDRRQFRDRGKDTTVRSARRQAKYGIKDSPEQHYQQTLAAGDFRGDPEKVKYMTYPPSRDANGWKSRGCSSTSCGRQGPLGELVH